MSDKYSPPKSSPKHQLLQEQLAELKLAQIAELYPQVLDDAARKNSSAFDVLAALVGAEITARRQRALQRRIREARLPPRKTLEEFDFTFPKRIPKQKIQRLCDCEFVMTHGCAVFIGPTGTGKTHFLTVIGYVACEREFTVRFTRVVDMLNELTTAQINGTLRKALRPYTRPNLLLLDELGYLPIDKAGADLLFQVVSQRYERGAMILTTNTPFKQWPGLFNNDSTLASALLDRLLHHAYNVVIDAKSYRMKDRAREDPQ